jgi:hypothetical protein
VIPAPLPARADSAVRLRTILRVAAVVVLLLHAFNYLYFFVDDEGIPFVYAQNVLAGHGLSYNPQDGHVEGYSDFLHVCLATSILAAVRALRAPRIVVFFVGKFLSLVFAAGIVWLSIRWFERLRVETGPALVAGLGSLVLAGPLAVWSASSLETVQFAFILLVLAFALSDEGAARISDRLAAIAASVLVLERIDGFVYAGGLLAAFLLVSASPRRRILLRRVVAPFLLVFITYHLWRLAYFHALLTPPLETKVLFKLRPHGTLVVRLPEHGYAARFFSLSWWVPAVAAIGAIVLAAIQRQRRVLAVAISTVLLTVYIGLVGDWMFGFRFFVGLVPLFGVLIAWDVSRINAWRRSAGWAVAVLVVAAAGQSAVAFEGSYRDYQRRPAWLSRPRLGLPAYFPLYGLQRALAARLKPGDTIATNLGGFVPFMVDAPNVDNLGLVTPLFAELPTTDVIFTEVGRYSPMTAKPILRAADAYLMFRAPDYIAEPGTWIANANGGRQPDAIFGNRYRLVTHEDDTAPIAQRDTPWCMYARAAPLDEFHTCADLYLENLAHVSSVREVRIDGEGVPPPRLQTTCPYLAEQAGHLSVSAPRSIDILFSHTNLPVHELYIGNVTASAPVRLTVSLGSHAGRVYEQSFDVAPGRPLSWYTRLPAAVGALRAELLFTTPEAKPATVSITDVRVQGQRPALAAFISQRLGVHGTDCAPR